MYKWSYCNKHKIHSSYDVTDSKRICILNHSHTIHPLHVVHITIAQLPSLCIQCKPQLMAGQSQPPTPQKKKKIIISKSHNSEL
jgi:hypothetical protein